MSITIKFLHTLLSTVISLLMEFNKVNAEALVLLPILVTMATATV